MIEKKKYLVKCGSKLRMFEASKLENMSESEILIIGIASFLEQKSQLIKDATASSEKMFYGHKVVDALEVSLSKMEEKIPNIRTHANIMVFGKNVLN